MPVIPAPLKTRQKDHELQVILSNNGRMCQKERKRKKECTDTKVVKRIVNATRDPVKGLELFTQEDKTQEVMTSISNYLKECHMRPRFRGQN